MSIRSLTLSLLAFASTTQAITTIPTPIIPIVLLCMHEDSIVMTPSGHMRVDQIKPGDKVATQTVGGIEHYVTVLKNDEYIGDWEFISFDFADSRSMNITSNHVMAVQRSFGPGVSVAADVDVGHKMYIKDNIGDLRPTEVVAKKTHRHAKKFNLVTESGSVIVDGVLTTTICDQGVETLPLGLEAAQKHYVESHKQLFEEFKRDLKLA